MANRKELRQLLDGRKSQTKVEVKNQGKRSFSEISLFSPAPKEENQIYVPVKKRKNDSKSGSLISTS